MADTGTIGVVEADMAALAEARTALLDLEGWLLSLPHRRRITPGDMIRVADDLHRIGTGLDTTRKYLAHLHREGWKEGAK